MDCCDNRILSDFYYYIFFVGEKQGNGRKETVKKLRKVYFLRFSFLVAPVSDCGVQWKEKERFCSVCPEGME